MIVWYDDENETQLLSKCFKIKFIKPFNLTYNQCNRGSHVEISKIRIY